MIIVYSLSEQAGNVKLAMHVSDAQLATATANESSVKTSLASFLTTVTGQNIIAADVSVKVLTDSQQADVWGLNEE